MRDRLCFQLRQEPCIGPKVFFVGASVRGSINPLSSRVTALLAVSIVCTPPCCKKVLFKNHLIWFPLVGDAWAELRSSSSFTLPRAVGDTVCCFIVIYRRFAADPVPAVTARCTSGDFLRSPKPVSLVCELLYMIAADSAHRTQIQITSMWYQCYLFTNWSISWARRLLFADGTIPTCGAVNSDRHINESLFSLAYGTLLIDSQTTESYGVPITLEMLLTVIHHCSVVQLIISQIFYFST